MLRLRSQAIRRLGNSYSCPSCLATAVRSPAVAGLRISITARQRVLNGSARTFTSSSSRAGKDDKIDQEVSEREKSPEDKGSKEASSTPPRSDNTAATLTGPNKKKSKSKKGKPAKPPVPKSKNVASASPEDTERQLQVLQGALAALKNVLDQQNIRVDDIKKPLRAERRNTIQLNSTKPSTNDMADVPTEITAGTPTGNPPDTHTGVTKSEKKNPKRKSKLEKIVGETTTIIESRGKPANQILQDHKELGELETQLKAHVKKTSKFSKTSAAKQAKSPIGKEKSAKKLHGLKRVKTAPGVAAGVPPKRKKPLLAKGHVSLIGSEQPIRRAVQNDEYIKPQTPSHIRELNPDDIDLVPIENNQPPVAKLAHGLERVLFNQGVYDLQDPRSKVYNFDPYLANIMPIKQFDFNALQQYVTSSKDTALINVARENGKKYSGSTSSMTSMLSHFHYLLSGWRTINSGMVSKGFDVEFENFTNLLRSPAATFLHYKDGVYAIDADKEFDQASILSMLGKSMEKLLTLPVEGYERYRRRNSHEITDEERNAPEAYHFTGLGDFMMRSQLDAHDPRVPGTGMFDIKTRSVVTIRMDSQGYEKGLGYEIRNRRGNWESYEREYHDMIRSAFLKYSLQVRMGRMDGIFVAFHNTQRIFGFQYISLDEMDFSLHGQSDRTLGDREFKASLSLLNQILDRATEKFPKKSLRLFVETRTSANTPFMYIFARPVEPEEIEAVQNAGKASADAIERELLGLQNEIESESATDAEPESEQAAVDEEKANDSPEDLEDGEGDMVEDTTASWDEIQIIVEEAMEDEELGVGAVRQAIEDALEESGLLEEQNPEMIRHYVDALLNAVTGESTQSSPVADETTDALEAAEEVTDENSSSAESDNANDVEVESIEQNEQHLPDQEVNVVGKPESGSESVQTVGDPESTDAPTTREMESARDELTFAEESSQQESEIGNDDSQDEAASSPNMSTLRNAILRITRRIDEDGLASKQRDEAVSTKLQDFEQILSNIISESKEDEQDRSDKISAGADSSTAREQGATDQASPSAATDTTTSEPTASTKEEAEPYSGPLLGMVLTIRNKVNDKFVTRPENLTKDDTWEVEYNMEELEDERAHRLFRMCERRRAAGHGAGGKKRHQSNTWGAMFGGALPKYVKEGRSFRKQENKRARSEPVQIFGQGSKSYTEVFGKK